MNPNKKNVDLYGMAVLPVAEGVCALLACGGHYIRTSRVVKIHEYTPHILRFETVNSNYSVVLTPSPLVAVSLIPMGMTAA